MKRGEILKTVYERGPSRDGLAALEQGTKMIAKDRNELVNAYGADLPVLVACIKGSMPHWERHLGESGMELCHDVMSLMMTVDTSELQRAGE